MAAAKGKTVTKATNGKGKRTLVSKGVTSTLPVTSTGTQPAGPIPPAQLTQQLMAKGLEKHVDKKPIPASAQAYCDEYSMPIARQMLAVQTGLATVEAAKTSVEGSLYAAVKRIHDDAKGDMALFAVNARALFGSGGESKLATYVPGSLFEDFQAIGGKLEGGNSNVISQQFTRARSLVTYLQNPANQLTEKRGKGTKEKTVTLSLRTIAAKVAEQKKAAANPPATDGTANGAGAATTPATQPQGGAQAPTAPQTWAQMGAAQGWEKSFNELAASFKESDPMVSGMCATIAAHFKAVKAAAVNNTKPKSK